MRVSNATTEQRKQTKYKQLQVLTNTNKKKKKLGLKIDDGKEAKTLSKPNLKQLPKGEIQKNLKIYRVEANSSAIDEHPESKIRKR